MQPGTVIASTPRSGILPLYFSKYFGVHAAGERPEAFRPCSLPPSQTSAKASEPRPLLHGSTTVSVAAVAMIASTAEPPRASICRPA